LRPCSPRSVTSQRGSPSPSFAIAAAAAGERAERRTSGSALASLLLRGACVRCGHARLRLARERSAREREQLLRAIWGAARRAIAQQAGGRQRKVLARSPATRARRRRRSPIQNLQRLHADSRSALQPRARLRGGASAEASAAGSAGGGPPRSQLARSPVNSGQSPSSSESEE
jgi:hypothetical protein